MAIMRVKARWTIPGAGTAYSVFHFSAVSGSDPVGTEANQAAEKTRTFFDAVKGLLPGVVMIDVQKEVEILDVESGNLFEVINATDQLQVVGGASVGTAWSAPSGACITWGTSGLRTLSSKPRRVRGRTFLVPLTTTSYDSNGNLSATALTTINTAATNLRTPGTLSQLVIFGRPGVGGSPAGVVHTVTSSRITDQSAILRSRRS
jgi:hypothetical protein